MDGVRASFLYPSISFFLINFKNFIDFLNLFFTLALLMLCLERHRRSPLHLLVAALLCCSEIPSIGGHLDDVHFC